MILYISSIFIFHGKEAKELYVFAGSNFSGITEG